MSPTPVVLTSVCRIFAVIALLLSISALSACDKAANLLGIEEPRGFPPTLTGRVIQRDSSPIVGAHVEALGSGRIAKTGGSGAFQIDDISPGKVRLAILKEGYADTILTNDLPAGFPGEMWIGILPLSRHSTSLNGSLSPKTPGGVALEDQSASSLTDPDGDFRFDHAALGEYQVLAATMDGRCGSLRIRATLDGISTADPIELTNACGSVVGRVTDEVGKPLAAVTIRAFEGIRTTTTDGAGRFRLDGIPPGTRIALRVSGPDDVLRIYGVRVASLRTTNLGSLRAGKRTLNRPWIVPGLQSILPSDTLATLVADTVIQDSSFRLRRFAWSLDSGATWDSTRENRLRIPRSIFSSLGNGHHVLVRGVALDGRSTPSARILLNFQPALDLDPPRLSRLGPSKDSSVRWKDSVLVVGWEALDPSGMARVSIGDSLVKPSSGKYRQRLVLPIGSTVVRILAHDSAGNSSADSLTLTRASQDTTPPTVLRTNPRRDTTLRWKDSILVASWFAADSSGILAASIQGKMVHAPSGRFSLSVIVPVGSSYLTFRVRDSAGVLALDSVRIQRAPPDRSPPSILRLAPTRDTIIAWKDSTLLVTWEARDASGIDRAMIGDSSLPSGTGRYSRRITFPIGSTVVRFTALDSVGLAVSDSIRIVRTKNDSTAPEIRRVWPSRDTTLRWKDSLLTVAWKASDVNGIRAASINDVQLPPDGEQFSRTLVFPVGYSTVRFRVRDSAGFLSVDSLRILRANQDRTPPTLLRISPTRDTVVRWKDSVIAFTWSAADVSGIASASINGTVLAPTGGRYAWTSNFPIGISTIRFQARDSVGQISVDSLRIERLAMDSIPPYIERHAPTSAASVVHYGDSSLELKWRVDDDRGLDSLILNGTGVTRDADGFVTTIGKLETGINTFTLVAGDHDGNRSFDRVLVERLSRDEIPPTISRRHPLLDTAVRWIDSTLMVRWTVSDNDSLASVFLGSLKLAPARDSTVEFLATLRIGDTVLTLIAEDRDGNRSLDSIRVSRMPQDTSRLTVSLPSSTDTLGLDDTIRVSSNGPVEYAVTTGLWLPFPEKGLVLPRSCTLSIRTQTPNEIPRTWQRALVLDSWDPARVYDTIIDSRDGRVYRIVTIGTQTWMAENLAYRGPPGATTFVGTCPSGSAEACTAFGRLYTWAEVMAGKAATAKVPSGVQGLCPTGWHVPSDSEWTILVKEGLSSSRPGSVLRSRGGWRQGNGIDSVGFHALAAGHRFLTGAYYQEGEQGYWWTTTQAADTATAWSRRLYGGYDGIYRNYYNKGYGLSLRCLKNP